MEGGVRLWDKALELGTFASQVNENLEWDAAVAQSERVQRRVHLQARQVHVVPSGICQPVPPCTEELLTST
jgi:hypothetical protein